MGSAARSAIKAASGAVPCRSSTAPLARDRGSNHRGRAARSFSSVCTRVGGFAVTEPRATQASTLGRQRQSQSQSQSQRERERERERQRGGAPPRVERPHCRLIAQQRWLWLLGRLRLLLRALRIWHWACWCGAAAAPAACCSTRASHTPAAVRRPVACSLH